MKVNEFTWMNIDGERDDSVRLLNPDGSEVILPVVQGMLTIHHNAIKQNVLIVIRDGEEKPVLGVKFSRRRWSWFLRNQMNTLFGDFVNFGKLIGLMSEPGDECPTIYIGEDVDRRTDP